jgi:hypothetical protein
MFATGWDEIRRELGKGGRGFYCALDPVTKREFAFEPARDPQDASVSATRECAVLRWARKPPMKRPLLHRDLKPRRVDLISACLRVWRQYRTCTLYKGASCRKPHLGKTQVKDSSSDEDQPNELRRSVRARTLARCSCRSIKFLLLIGGLHAFRSQAHGGLLGCRFPRQ